MVDHVHGDEVVEEGVIAGLLASEHLLDDVPCPSWVHAVSVPSPRPAMTERSARNVVEELIRRQEANDPTVLDDLIAQDMVNHAAGPQGRVGLRQIMQTIEHDFGPVTFEQHHLVADGDLVVQHVTVHGTHRASTMPLLAEVPASGRTAAWRFIHIWRVADGQVVEHWACRDDMGLVERLTAT